MNQANTKWRFTRFRRFSLRTGLALLLLICIAFGFAARWIQSVRERGEAQLWLVKHTESYYEQNDKPSRFVQFIRKWVHPEYDEKLDAVSLNLYHCDEDHLNRLAMLFSAKQIVIRGDFDAAALDRVFQTPGLKWLILDCKIASVQETGQWKNVKQASALEWVDLGEDRSLPDSLMEAIIQLPKIRRIRMFCERQENLREICKAPNIDLAELWGSEAKWALSTMKGRDNSPPLEPTQAPSKSVFDELAKRPNLDRLLLTYIEMKDPSVIQDFCEQSVVTVVRGDACRITPPCLAQFAKLKRLDSLTLGSDPITEEHLRVLKTMTKLKSLYIGKQTPQEHLDELQKALPNCTIGKV